MQQSHHADNPGVIEVVPCRYEAKFGQPIAPQPPRFETDNCSGPWSMQQCSWTGGCVVIVWSRLTRSPLIAMPPRDQPPPLPPPAPDATPPAYVDKVGPAPVAPPPGHNVPPMSGEEMDQAMLGRLVRPQVLAGPPVAVVPELPNLAPPPPQALPHYHHLPSYARPRAPLALQQNVTVRGGTLPTTAPTAPPYNPPSPSSPASVQYGVAGDGGLLAGAEVRACSVPLPPSPLDFPPAAPAISAPASSAPAIGAVPPMEPAIAPARPLSAPPPQAPNAANAATSTISPMDLSGHASTPRTEPSRLAMPPTFPNNSPPDRSLQPLPPPPERIAPHVEQPETAAP